MRVLAQRQRNVEIQAGSLSFPYAPHLWHIDARSPGTHQCQTPSTFHVQARPIYRVEDSMLWCYKNGTSCHSI